VCIWWLEPIGYQTGRSPGSVSPTVTDLSPKMLLTYSPILRSWLVAAGLGLSVFAIVALSGPGRFDNVDGETRYEVARSLVDHGDHIIRNPSVWFGVFPGRDGQPYTYYRFPQSFLGVPAIVMSDWLGGVSEGRRQFAFVLTSAAAAAVLSIAYFIWFRRTGRGDRSALRWAVLGIVCTPAWYYGTSTFDDLLGAAVIVAAVVIAEPRRHCRLLSRALWSGLIVGLAFNCKQPLAVFGLAVLAAVDDPEVPLRRRLAVASLVALGVAAGAAAYLGYHDYKFPAETRAAHGPLLAAYTPVWPGKFKIALIVLLLSPGAGVLWYSPSLLLCVSGMASWGRKETRFIAGLAISTVLFVAFIASMSIFKGDPSWGPRYMTPVLALFWLFAPDGAAKATRPAAASLLVVSFAVQLAGLAVEPQRLYLQRGLPPGFSIAAPLLFFLPQNAHLISRPREIAEVWQARNDSGLEFSPALTPTDAWYPNFAPEKAPSMIARYKVLNAFRPWWISFQYLGPNERPVPIGFTVVLLLGICVLGCALIVSGSRMERNVTSRRGKAAHPRA
jgi:hypothetical protein